MGERVSTWGDRFTMCVFQAGQSYYGVRVARGAECKREARPGQARPPGEVLVPTSYSSDKLSPEYSTGP